MHLLPPAATPIDDLATAVAVPARLLSRAIRT